MSRSALNERCLTEVTKAFGDVHPVVARVIDQKGQMLLAEKDTEGAANWFAEARQVIFDIFVFPSSHLIYIYDSILKTVSTLFSKFRLFSFSMMYDISFIICGTYYYYYSYYYYSYFYYYY